MIPRDRSKNLTAKIIEFKVAKGRTSLKTALAEARDQIEKRDYAAKLREAQCERILKIAIAVKGKAIAIEVG
jgi:hypothetical protein